MNPYFLISPEDRLYKRAAYREAASWGRESAAELRKHRPRNHPLVRGYFSRLITEDEDETDWIWWFVRNSKPYEHALSLGSGIGLLEERMLRGGVFKNLDVVDFSAQAVRVFQERLSKRGVETPVNARIGDLNFIELPPGTYDFILAATSLHHVINLEHLLEQVRRRSEEHTSELQSH